ncbi:hypothetical protein FPQ18DRAFT_314688 [Pyronema domesticum]|uniref:Uncharacterized protein n=1 Tax=Pyronema omphalodes (strain CBS 100304) TaxID=1076935 RepID=U4L9B7_PYROM|nr:hypothetical protein FPQ18DRAFT_314688 [Pyronema domesticum]CCX10161.1 Similar to hypothetical protein [Tuber melanosporum Mel28]; acc. no. XP_002840652 [Pyronema omphalodes CBS 100304]
MKLLWTSIILLATPLALAQKERPIDRNAHARYASGEVMDGIMKMKQETWDEYQAMGYFKPGRHSSTNKFSPCKKGYVTLNDNGNTTNYACRNLDVTGHLTHDDLGSIDPTARIGSSIWGYTIDGREFVAIGQTDGAAFAEVVGKGWWNYVPYFGKKAGTLDYIGRLPQTPGALPSIWREIKGYKHYAIIGSEAVAHGIQIFDFHKLLEVRSNRLSTSTKTFDPLKDISHFADLPVGRSHNVVNAEASNHIIAVGAQPRTDACQSGLIFIDVSDPSKPKRTGCAADGGYVHDAQCLIYRGPDAKYDGTEICYGYNEDSLTIYDITDKTKTNIISNTSYVGATYTHQGWVLDTENQEFLLLDDELDEQRGVIVDGKPVTYIWNITSLENPILTGSFKSSIVSIDHNQFVKNMFTYQSNYGAGLRIWDVSSIPRDPTGKGVEEVAYFDVFPDDDSNPKAVFLGSWANYPFFKSGYIVVNTYDRGAFVVKRSQEVNSQSIRAEF